VKVAAARRPAACAIAGVLLACGAGCRGAQTASGSSQSFSQTGHLRILDWAGFKAAATFTFDDSQPSQIDAWPVLKAEGVRMTFYVNASQSWYSGYDETWSDVATSGSEIGNHTYHHCYETLRSCPGASTVPFATADLEVDSETAYVIEHHGVTTVSTMAYPFGDLKWAPFARKRFFLGRGVHRGMVAPGDDSDPFDLPCVSASGGESASVFDASVDAARAGGKWVIFLFHSLLPTAYSWYAGVNLTSVTGTMEYAKSRGDVWIDSMVNVGAYWIGQKTLSGAAPTVSAGRQTWTWTLPDHFPRSKHLLVTVDGGSLSQKGSPLPRSDHGYYEVALDAGSLTWSP
jgi:peptidoglycan/xylan/chitin deacetylase (PgdA/CDA1 family)